jgi:TrmH family RNA methyltransferase
VEPKVLAAASGIASGTRALAVYEERWTTPSGPLCVYLHGVHDPGNVGTVLRGAQAFGASSVVIGPGTADPFSPKAVRASMGAVFGVPLARASSIDELPGVKVALAPGQGPPLQELELGDDVTLMVGSEREGLPPDAITAADHVVHIPIECDSLNAAMAATIALYELGNRMRAR